MPLGRLAWDVLRWCMQIVYRARNQQDAHLVRDILTQQGIPVHVAEAAPTAGEEPIPNATGERLAEAVRACGHHDVTFVASRSEVATVLRSRVQPGDLVLTLGAGDINQSGLELLALLKGGS